MFGKSEVASKDWNAKDWRENELYLYGVDLFNFGYWWEAHAAWEALWQTTGRREAAGRFLQGLIQVAAALVQQRAGRTDGARRLASKGLARLGALSGELGPAAGNAILYMGVDVHGFAAATERYFEVGGSAESGPEGPPFLVLA